jgi:hypothetical protein
MIRVFKKNGEIPMPGRINVRHTHEDSRTDHPTMPTDEFRPDPEMWLSPAITG